jgi:hypothetical protein
MSDELTATRYTTMLSFEPLNNWIEVHPEQKRAKAPAQSEVRGCQPGTYDSTSDDDASHCWLVPLTSIIPPS